MASPSGNRSNNRSPSPNSGAFVELVGSFSQVKFPEPVNNSFLIFRVDHQGETPRSLETKFRSDVCATNTVKPTFNSSTFTISAPVQDIRPSQNNESGIVVEAFCLHDGGAELQGACHIGFKDIGDTLRSRETVHLDVALDSEGITSCSLTFEVKLGRVVKPEQQGAKGSKSKDRVLMVWVRDALNLPDADGKVVIRTQSENKFSVEDPNTKLPSSFVSAKLLRDISRPAKAATQMINYTRNPSWSRPLSISLAEDDVRSGQTLFMALINNNTKKLIQKVLLPLGSCKPNWQYNFRFEWERDGANTYLDIAWLLYQGVPQTIEQYSSKSTFIRLQVTVNQFIEMLPDHIDCDELTVCLRLVGEGKSYAKNLPRPGKKSKKRKGPDFPLQVISMPNDDPFEDAEMFNKNGPFVTRGIGREKPKIWNEGFVFEFPPQVLQDNDSYLAVEIFSRKQPTADSVMSPSSPEFNYSFVAYALLPLSILSDINLDRPEPAVLQLDDITLTVIQDEKAKAVFSLELKAWSSDLFLKTLTAGSAEQPYDISKRARTAQVDRIRKNLASKSNESVSPSKPTPVAGPPSSGPSSNEGSLDGDGHEREAPRIPDTAPPVAREPSRVEPQQPINVAVQESSNTPPAQQQMPRQQPPPREVVRTPPGTTSGKPRPKSTHGKRDVNNQHHWDDDDDAHVVTMEDSVSRGPATTHANTAANPTPQAGKTNFRDRLRARQRGTAEPVEQPRQPARNGMMPTHEQPATGMLGQTPSQKRLDEPPGGMLGAGHPPQATGMLPPAGVAGNGTGGAAPSLLPHRVPAANGFDGPELQVETSRPLESKSSFVPFDQMIGDESFDVSFVAPELHVQIPGLGRTSNVATTPGPKKVASDEYQAISDMNVSYGSTLSKVMAEIEETQQALQADAIELVEHRRQHGALVKEAVLLQERASILEGVASDTQSALPLIEEMPDLNTYPDDMAISELNTISAKAVSEKRRNAQVEKRLLALSKQIEEKNEIPQRLRQIREAYTLVTAKIELLLQSNRALNEARAQASEQEHMIETREGVIEICLNNSARGLELREEIAYLEDENAHLEARRPSHHEQDRQRRRLREERAALQDDLQHEQDRAERRARKQAEAAARQQRPDPRLEEKHNRATEENRMLKLKLSQYEAELRSRQDGNTAHNGRPQTNHGSRAASRASGARPAVDPSRLTATEADRDDLETRVEEAEMMIEALSEERDSGAQRHAQSIAEWQSKIETLRARGGLTSAGHRRVATHA